MSILQTQYSVFSDFKIYVDILALLFSKIATSINFSFNFYFL